MDKIGYLREIVKERIGRIYPKGEIRGYKAKVEVKKEQ